jgi:hypothetical protein
LRVTVQELAAWPKNSVGTKEAAELIGCSRWGLTLAAKQGQLAIPYTFSGNRLHISKSGLLEFLGYRVDEDGALVRLSAERDKDGWFIRRATA